MLIETQPVVQQKSHIVFHVHIHRILQCDYRQILRVRIRCAVYSIVQTQQIFPVLKQPAKNRILVISSGWQRRTRRRFRYKSCSSCSISFYIHLSSFAGERKSPAFSLFLEKHRFSEMIVRIADGPELACDRKYML